MSNLGTIFLWALAACTVCQGSLAQDLQSGCSCPQGVEAQLEGQLQALYVKLERSLFSVQMRLESRIEAVLQEIENKNPMQAVQNRTEAVQEAFQDSDGNTILPGFERIGSRYFRIVEETETWSTARKKCREMGGHLAAFRNEEEVTAIREQLRDWGYYWLGINDRETEGHFVSVASHKAAPFLKWFIGEPNDKDQLQNCVFLHYGEMWDTNCSSQSNYICQADSET